MRGFNFTATILFILLIACNVGKRQQVEQIIKDFEINNVSDKREIVFDIQITYNHGELTLKGETSEPILKNHLLTKLKPIQFVDSIVVLPDSSVDEKTYALVTVPVANLKATPSYSSELVTQAILGTPVKILKKRKDWFCIQTPDKYISWVNETAISPVTGSELQKWRNSERVIFTGINGSIFKDESLTTPISDVTLGSILEKGDKSYHSLKVRFPDGRTGFINTQNWIDFDIFKTETEYNREQIVSVAKQLNGRSYLWGGTSVNLMDCSGFVKTVYFSTGIILARDASLQALHGFELRLSEVEPGDLLFFGQNAAKAENIKITHVALSLGGTEFIHASGFVKQNSFDPASEIYSEYREKSFVKALRIIGLDDPGIQFVKNHPWY